MKLLKALAALCQKLLWWRKAEILEADFSQVAVLVPVKAFTDAKMRLADVLIPSQRKKLARKMAEIVVLAAQDFKTFVVCESQEVESWAKGMQREGLSLSVLRCPGMGLNEDLGQAVAHLEGLGFARAIVAHGDLPYAEHFREFAGEERGQSGMQRQGATSDRAVYITADRHGQGTNVLSVPLNAGFVLQFGEGSYARHVSEAKRLGLPVVPVSNDDLAWDVNNPSDITPEIYDLLSD